MIDTLRHGPIVELRLNRPPVNALDAALLDDLLDALVGAAQSGARGIVLSGRPGMFSAGLDIVRALELDAHGMRGLCSVFFGVLQQVAVSPVPVAAALTGYTAAGGAVIANLADYRVLAAGDAGIGFNEMEVGIFPGPIVHRAVARQVGPRQAERLLTGGELLGPEEALRIGLVDAVAPPAEVVPRAVAWLERLASLPREPMERTRALARADLVEIFEDLDQSAIEMLIRAWFAPDTRAALEAAVARLRG